MIWIDVTARAARQVRALAAEHAGPQRETVERFGLRIAVQRDGAGDGDGSNGDAADADGPQVLLSLSPHRTPTDLVLPRFGFDVVVHGADAGEVDGLRIDFLTTPDGAGFVVDRVPRPRRPDPMTAVPAPPTAAPAELVPGDDALTERVRAALEEVRPALRADGGDVELAGVSGDVAYVRLQGACSGCSAALLTLEALVERAVLAAVPEVSRTVLVA